MGFKLHRIVQAGFVLGVASMVVAASASAGGVPKIMPADPNSIPAHDQINKLVSLVLTLFVLGLIVTIIMSIWTIINRMRGSGEMAGGAAGALVISLIFLGLTLNQGTGYLTGWTGFFG